MNAVAHAEDFGMECVSATNSAGPPLRDDSSASHPDPSRALALGWTGLGRARFRRLALAQYPHSGQIGPIPRIEYAQATHFSDRSRIAAREKKKAERGTATTAEIKDNLKKEMPMPSALAISFWLYWISYNSRKELTSLRLKLML